jgi:hypothetical protein
MSQPAGSVDEEHEWFRRMQAKHPSDPGMVDSKPSEESVSRGDQNTYFGASEMPVLKKDDIPWKAMYPATNQHTIQPITNNTDIEPYQAPAWVSPSVANTLASMFDVDGCLRDLARPKVGVTCDQDFGNDSTNPFVHVRANGNSKAADKSHNIQCSTAANNCSTFTTATLRPPPGSGVTSQSASSEMPTDDLDELGNALSEQDLIQMEKDLDDKATMRIAGTLRANKKQAVTSLGVSQDQIDAILCADTRIRNL